MGRGDIKTRKGKITAGSYGNTRPHKVAKKVVVAKEVVVAEEEKPKKKAPAKKAKDA